MYKIYEDDDPMVLFRRAFAQASEAETFDPARAALATTDRQGRPDVRFVLVRAHDDGFRFFTNYSSVKAEQLGHQPAAALAFHWSSIGVQVRVRGIATVLDSEDSDTYFASRPRGSQLSAWASEQSRPIADRAALESRFADVEQRFAGHERVTRPPFWGGYLLRPECIEFWSSGADRLHDRRLFERTKDGRWKSQRLQP